MSLQLDARRRAMLEEMGVRYFAPADAAGDADSTPGRPSVEAGRRSDLRPAPAAGAAAARPATAQPVPAAAPEGQRVAPAAAPLAGVAALDWSALVQAVDDWAAARRRKPVFGTGDLRPDWLCIGDPPVEEEERQGLPFAGEPGLLLDNMLAAVGASRQRGAYLTNVLKCRLPEGLGQEPAEVAESLEFLRRQVQLLQPRVILAMGRFAVQLLLQSQEPAGRLRGQVHRYAGVPVVVSYHPVSLLRTPADKAKAWADLCLAQAVLRGDA